MVPSDPIPSLAHRRHARLKHRIEKRRMIRRSAPPGPISRSRDRSLPAHRSLSSQRSRPLVTAFPSPATAAPSLEPPFRGQWSRPATSVTSRLASTPGPPSAPQLPPVCPGGGWLLASGPWRFHAPVRQAASSASTPLRDSYLPRDRSVQQIPPPGNSPSEPARFPLAPRRRSIARLAADQRSKSATFPEARPFLKPLGTFSTMPPTPFPVNRFRMPDGAFSSRFISLCF